MYVCVLTMRACVRIRCIQSHILADAHTFVSACILIDLGHGLIWGEKPNHLQPGDICFCFTDLVNTSSPETNGFTLP